MQLANPELDALSSKEGIETIDGDILCHAGHQGAYTDVGSKEEIEILHELRNRPWRDVVQRRFAERLPWLYRIITDPSRSRLLDVVDAPEGGRFLDVGSGWGQLTIPLARKGEAYALDQTVGRLRILREIGRQEGVRPRLLCGDIHTFPIRQGYFDLIILNGSLEYTNIGRSGTDFDSHVHALRRVRHALAPGGRAYVGIENALGVKYLLGAPDDHTNKKGFTYRVDREDGAAARTWSLDQYLRLFKEAGLAVETAYACFPDYKLIRHMVPLNQVDEFLLAHGLPATEHSGTDGAPLGLDPELRSLYENFARMGVARNFVPSFGFVLAPRGEGVANAADIDERGRTLVLGMLRDAGLLEGGRESEVKLERVAADHSLRLERQTARFNVFLKDHSIASLKCVPMSGWTDPDAILAVYREYRTAKSFRPVRLIGAEREAGQLWLLEEFIVDAVSLDELVVGGEMSEAEAAERIVRVVDDIFDGSPPADEKILERELAECEAAFKSLFDPHTLSAAVFSAFRDMILARRGQLRTVLSTRDYIGRNLVRTSGREWVLLDYDLSCRSVLFCLSVARNLIQAPFCADRLFAARVFDGLDPALVSVAAIAMEYALQRQVNPPNREAEIRRQFREHFLRVWAPKEIDDLRTQRTRCDNELRAARAYQERLEAEVENARAYQRSLEQLAGAGESRIGSRRLPRVDILVVSYNSARWLDGFLASLKRLDYPADHLRLVFIDNGSSDDSLEKIRAAAATLPMRLDFIGTGRNLGFTGGYEEAFRYAEGDYYFVVNLDTALAPDVINKLVAELERDPQVGIAEARQSPRVHPKYYDAVTRETSWCSGACMMIRPAALRRVGGGFERNFFMYCEDVDLSWRMWLHGWKCVYVPDAVVEHYTEDLDPKKTPKTQHYYTMRNGALMHAMYGSKAELALHYAAMLRLALLSRNPLWHKWLTFKAIFASLRALPAALRGRERRGRLGRHPWVFFNGWLFGRHARDLALATDNPRSKVEVGAASTGLVVSVVIPTHNRAESLPLVLRRLMAQGVGADRFEVIVVDSVSGDRTPQMLDEQVRRYANLTALRSEKSGAAAARNMGLAAAKGPLVLLLDDDILVGPDFIRQVVSAHRDHPGRILLGRIVAPWDDSTDPFERYLLQVQDVNIYDFPDNANVPPNYFYTACVAIPRDVLGATRFDEGFSVYGVEDIEFGFRLLCGNRRMVYLPDLQVLHDYHPEYEPFRRKKYKAGYSLGYFHQRHPEQAQQLTFGARFVRNYSLLRILRTLSAPIAKLALFWERIRYRTGPVNRFLFRWWYVDLRIRLYEGLLRFKRGEPPP